MTNEIIIYSIIILIAIFYKYIVKFLSAPFGIENPKFWLRRHLNEKQNSIFDIIGRLLFFLIGFGGLIYTLYFKK